ncbi:CS domain protein, putative [Plasmodium chabaudi chabaudi]|uniref:CS domain protein, putative n=2 Tax=Plasmodium chabaudi TaxID=5825 RepID=A0A077TP52_PLACU|nr:HSP90 co-chaperone p23, putative [Plasmodium chabaudi chabaudi]SCM20399.1 CS domain protein, putative [Plasmodium chabaudi adami]SCM21483.1 CS domain protein, putative [Plasmodium chabaudi chabaudi]SCN59824.1 CS domain protein, putative [Plasmodium chabaudi chabaudi]SCN59825.1 CS domain protein, putative [Plasmodium chabaudi adami]VTZ68489.1 HSP90 co-chaperone p23, putative [Plasmodium chabaudi chabaudi]|eukprot:XP_743391.1 CS domain protein, putative [Plasmodium chabaudi chabaudi]
MGELYNKRHKYMNNGVLIYEWEQTIDEVNIYINMNSNINKNDLDINIKSKRVNIGLKGAESFLEGELFSLIDEECSYWYIDDNILHILLTKVKKAEVWNCVFKGHKNLNAVDENNTKKKMLLERFQMEHPNFDFSSASFNGQVPDARTFMGGVKY